MDPARPTPHVRPRLRVRPLAIGLLLVAALAVPGAAGADARSVVVTTPILGSVVRELAGESAQVTVLMEPGVDPHDWSPSAREIALVFDADLVVANGLDLEAGLADALEEAEASGVPVFHATDWVTVRVPGAPAPSPAAGGSPAPSSSPEPDHEEEHAHEAGHDHDHAGGDPHFWTDPVAMTAVVAALADALAAAGIDVSLQRDQVTAALTEVDAEIAARIAAIPEERRRIVTGHESLGYFADRYGIEVVGAVIPGLSTQGEVSAQELGALAAAIRESGVTAIIVEVGTPQAVAEAIAAETGARIVPLADLTLPPDGSYISYLRGIAETVITAIG